jgi:hypothetical protein
MTKDGDTFDPKNISKEFLDTMRRIREESEKLADNFTSMYVTTKDLSKLTTFFQTLNTNLKDAKKESAQIRKDFKSIRDFAKEAANGLKDLSSAQKLYGLMEETAKDLSRMPEFMENYQSKSIMARSAVRELNDAVKFGTKLDKDRMKQLNAAQEDFRTTQRAIAADSELNNAAIKDLYREIDAQNSRTLEIKKLMVQVDAKYLLQAREKWANESQTLEQLEAQVAEDTKAVSVQDARVALLKERMVIEERLAEIGNKRTKAALREKKALEDRLDVVATTYAATGGGVSFYDADGIKDANKMLRGVERERSESFQRQVAGNIVLGEQKERQAVKDILTQKKLGGYLQHINRTEDARLGILGGQLKSVKDFLKTAKTIPTVFMALDFLIKSGFDRFMALDAAAESFRKTTGFSVNQMKELRKDVEKLNVDFADMGVNIEGAYKAAQALSNVFERTSLVSKEALTNVSLLSANFGVTEEVSATVLENFMGIGNASEKAAFDTMKFGAALSEKTGVSFAKVMDDVSKATGNTINMIGAAPMKLMKAAIAARALGLDINKIAASQRKLLDFTSSINDELELSALLGKSISFQKARQLAYEGKSEESMKEVLKTVKAAGDFEKMNVYQREQLAKASGMDLKDLTKAMAVDKQRRAILYGTDEVKKKQLQAQEKELEVMRKQSEADEKDIIKNNQKLLQQQRMQGIMTKLKNIMESIVIAFADILEPIITPLMEVIVPALRVVSVLAKVFGFVLKALLTPITWIAKGIGAIANMVDGVVSSFRGMGDTTTTVLTTIIGLIGGVTAAIFIAKGGLGAFGESIKNVMGSFKDKLVGAKDAVVDFFKGKVGDKGKEGASTDAAAGAARASKSADSVSAASGEKVKTFLKDLAAGLKEMGKAGVFKGAINLIPAALGLKIMKSGADGAKKIEDIKSKKLKEGLEAIGEGLAMMGEAKVIRGAINMTIASIGLSVMKVGAEGAKKIEEIDGEKLKKGLGGIAEGLAMMGDAKVISGAFNTAVAAIGLSAMTTGARGAKAVEEIDAKKLNQGLLAIAEGLASMAEAKVFRGSLNLAIASVGLTAMIPGGIGAKKIQEIDGKKFKAGIKGLAEGIESMATGKVFLGSMAMGVAAIGLTAMIPGALAAALLGVIGKPIELGLKFFAAGIGHMAKPQVLLGALALTLVGASLIPFAFAMKMFGDVDWGAVGLGALALVGFTAAMFGLGALMLTGAGAIIFGAGVIAIAALGAALIPFGLAALAAGAGVKMLGEGIASSVDPILRLSQIDLTNTAAGIGAVGIALASFGVGSAAAGLGSFVGNLLGGDPIAKMEKLASLAPELQITAQSISTISDSLSKFAAADQFAKSVDTIVVSLEKMKEAVDEISLVKVAALAALGAVSSPAKGETTATDPAAGGMNGGGVPEKLDAIYNALVNGNVAVYMDGVKVSKTLASASA